MRSTAGLPVVRYAAVAPPVGWELGEETLPESLLHDEAVELLKALLVTWAARAEASASLLVVRNLTIRWDEKHPAFGIDPDVCVLSPAPPDLERLRSVRTWIEGHTPPLLAIEVVSETTPRKDYVVAPDKYAASGTGELVIFDPLLSGPSSQGGPFRLQVWRRDEDGAFTRVYAGDGPAHVGALDAYFVVNPDGRKLRIADDATAGSLWLTAEEAARAENERHRSEKELLRSEKESALARVAALEAELARRRP